MGPGLRQWEMGTDSLLPHLRQCNTLFMWAIQFGYDWSSILTCAWDGVYYI